MQRIDMLGTKGRTVSQTELASLLDLDRSTLRAWADDGLPHTKASGNGLPNGHRLPEVIKWLIGLDDADDDTDQHARLARVKADQIELQTAKLRGELLEAGEIEPGWTRLTMAFRDHVLRIPNVAEDLIGCDRHEMRAKIEERCRSALFELANVPVNEGDEPPQ